MSCIEREVKLIVLDTDPEMEVVEDDIRADLAKIGIKVSVEFLSREDYVLAEREGTYNMLFSRTWGAPYDPHSYLSSWNVPSHVEYSAIGNLDGSLTRDSLLAKIEAVQKELNPSAIREQWHEIMNDIHQQAIFLPLWGSRIPYVTNRRLDGFVPPSQAFTYPIETISVLDGSTTVTVAPGSGGALFKSVGPMNPHQYSPNQLFVNGWIYEGLVKYGQDGQILPALAESWDTEDIVGGGQRVTFQLRKGVTFHDGSDWNCTVAKLNFDHVLSDEVRERHSWYGTPSILSNWACNVLDEFVLETKTPFYPLLQELSYVRPLVFASAAAFEEGLDSDPLTHNSCRSGDFGSKWEYLEDSVVCKGLKAPIGTGPFKFVDRTVHPDDDTKDQQAVFARHDGYWGKVAEIETLVVKRYETTEEVFADLVAGNLDMVLGTGPLTGQQVGEIQRLHSTNLDVVKSEVLQNAVLVLNTNIAPTNDIDVRKAIIHAVDKAKFLDTEFSGLEQPVTELLPLSTPYADLDLNPKWSYDLEKATFINCPFETSSSSELSGGGIAGIAIGVIAFVGLAFALLFVVRREKQGKPVFAPKSETKSQA